jgi:hypothetical protein
MPLCSLLRGTGADETHSGVRGHVEGRKFSTEGHADSGWVRDPADVGGWTRYGNLFVGIFKKGHGSSVVDRFEMTDRGTVFNGLGSG